MTKIPGEPRDGHDDPEAPFEDEAFIAGVADVLRAPVRLDPGFSQRVIGRLERETPVRTARFGRGRHAVPFRERGAALLALAASITIVAFAGGYAVARTTARPALEPAVAAAPGDTVYIVRFVFTDPRASHVALVGSFNAWSAEATPLQAAAVPGVWTATVKLSEGVHEYAYLVDGNRWELDPGALVVADPLGIEASLIRVQSNGQTGS